MRRPELQPYFLSEQECKEIATRQMLSFITPPDSQAEPPPHVRPPSGESLFSYAAIPDDAFGDGPEIFNWKSRDIYDVDGLLLFRDQTLDLGSGNEWHVRTAASELLREQVWCVCAYGAPDRSLKVLIERALAELRNDADLEPFIAKDEENVRLVAYSYPRLGILCYSRTDHDAKSVIDIESLTIISIAQPTPPDNPEAVMAVWSPYDVVVRSTTAHFRGLWKRNLRTLPALPESREALLDAIRDAEDPNLAQNQHIIKPELTLIPQDRDERCAAATAQMILEHYGLNDKTQAEIADVMQTTSIGATPENQEAGLNVILNGRGYKAELDTGPTYEEALIELSANRPLKTGGPIHARAVAGFRVEPSGKKWLYIYDPQPTGLGSKCCEVWDQETHKNFMYVKPPKPPE